MGADGQPARRRRLTPVLGRLGDLRGERPVILGILVAVAAGTVLAIVASSLPLLLVGRILQGASYGLFPLSISVLRREMPEARLTVAMSVVSSTLAVGGVIGLVAPACSPGTAPTTGSRSGSGSASPCSRWPCAAWCCRTARRAAPAAWTGGERSCSVPAWCCSCCPSRRATPGAGPPRRRSAAWPARRSRWPAGSSSSGGRPSRWSARDAGRPAHVVPNIAGLMTGIALFASFLAVLAYVQAPPEVTGYGFGASVLEASVVYLLPGGVVGILLAPFAGRLVGRFGALQTLSRRRLGNGRLLLLACCAATPGWSSPPACSPRWR